MPLRTLFCLVGLLTLLSGCVGQSRSANLDTVHLPDQTSALVKAAESGDLAAVKSHVEDGEPLNQVAARGTPLTAAAAHGRDRIAWYLLQQGADPNLADAQGKTPLVAASAEGSQRLVRLMLSAGAQVNTADPQGRTPVSAAAEAGNLSVMRALLDAGGNVNIAPGGESLLMHVVRNGDLLMAEVLIAAGADAAFRADDGTTALTIARQKRMQDIEMLLIQAGAGQ